MIIFFLVVSILILLNRLIYINHPISLGFILIFYALIMGALATILISSWFLYLLVLVFLGGVIVLIIYIRTLSANEKFFIPYTRVSPLLIILFTLTLGFLYEFNKRTSLRSSSCFISNVYEQSNSSLTLVLIIYLLLTILCVVKLVKFEKGPLVSRL